MPDHAIVVGGSVAGLLTAHVLSEYFDQVTVLDRDIPGDEPGVRKAVPQGHHIHALLARGQMILEDFFPGMTEELAAEGVPVGDFGTTLAWYFGGRMMKQTPTGMTCVAAGRPRIEDYIRRRVAANPAITLTYGTAVTSLTWRDGRVTGVTADGDGPSRHEGALVVDATGRASRLPRWLADAGLPNVREDVVKMGLVYTTCDYALRPEYDPIGDGIAMLPVATPDSPRGAIYARLQDRYAISLYGLVGHEPPRDRAGFTAYVESLPVPEIARSVATAEPIAEPVSFRFPASIRRRYDTMREFPDGLIVLGDAFSIFNPVYGQGMTVAAMSAELLRTHLAEHDGVVRERALMRSLGRLVVAPWNLAAGADLGNPAVEGRRTPATVLGNRYITAMQRAAVHDEVLARTFLRVAGLVDSPAALLRPAAMARTLRGPGQAAG